MTVAFYERQRQRMPDDEFDPVRQVMDEVRAHLSAVTDGLDKLETQLRAKKSEPKDDHAS